MSYFTFSDVFRLSFALLGVISIIAFCLFIFRKICECKKNYDKNKLPKNNIIPIIHSTNPSIGDDDMITIGTHMDFVKAYEKVDKTKDIDIIMHTVGGELSSAEAICNCITNHQSKYTSKINVYIPYYSYSGGCMIALACDKIIILRNAILGPCDAQIYVTSRHSIAAIINTVDYKKSKEEKIDENWLASSYDAQLCKERQLEYVNKLIKFGKFNDNVGKTIYDEFFSGKHNHDKIFSAQEVKDLGLNVEIVDELPYCIKTIVDTIKN